MRKIFYDGNFELFFQRMRNDDLPRQADPRDPCLAQRNSKNFGESDEFIKNGYSRGYRSLYYGQKDPPRQVSSQDGNGTLHEFCL